MDDEEKAKLDRSLSLAEDNNRMIKKLYRAMRWSRALRIVYLVIIIGASLGIYYYIQPFIDSLTGAYGGVRETFLNVLINN